MQFEETTIGPCRLIRADCLDVLPTLRGVDAVVTDPPYGLGEKWRGGFSGRNGSAKHWGSGIPSWDVLQPEALRLSLEKCADAIVWGGQLYGLPPSMGWLAWDKCQEFSSGDFELAWTNRPIVNRVFRMSRIDAHWNSGERKHHPTQKPTALMTWCLGFLNHNTKTILDPFMGSGTTLVSCILTGRMGIGIEMEPKYFDIACKRIERAWQDKCSELPFEKPQVVERQRELVLEAV